MADPIRSEATQWEPGPWDRRYAEQAMRESEATLEESLHSHGANYYVLIPFQTARVALSAAEDIGATFDCCVVSSAAVDQDALLVKEPE